VGVTALWPVTLRDRSKEVPHIRVRPFDSSLHVLCSHSLTAVLVLCASYTLACNGQIHVCSANYTSPHCKLAVDKTPATDHVREVSPNHSLYSISFLGPVMGYKWLGHLHFWDVAQSPGCCPALLASPSVLRIAVQHVGPTP